MSQDAKISSDNEGMFRYEISDKQHLILPTGEEIDLSSKDAVAAAEAAGYLDGATLRELTSLMSARGFALVNGAFVPQDQAAADGYRRQTQTLLGAAGSQDPSLIDTIVQDPLFSQATNQLVASLGSSPTDPASIQLGGGYVNGNFLKEFSRTLSYIQAKYPEGDVGGILFALLKQGLEMISAQKNDELQDMDMLNKIKEKIGANIQVLTRTQALFAGEKEAYAVRQLDVDKDKNGKDIPLSNYMSGALDSHGEPIAKQPPISVRRDVNQSDIKQFTAEIENNKDEVSNLMQKAQTMYGDLEQKYNQLMNILALIQKSDQETMGRIIGNTR